ncbi:hypothetical protein B0H11DRAFT_2252723 [Mycena galericulata]|nr:hypothetical protein B0H11DRAFT_2252723 [Mycena galericulata]
MTVDWTRLNDLPENASVRDQLRTVESQVISEPDQDLGPPEEGGNPVQQDPLFTRGFVPNVTTGQTEIEQLHAAAFHNDQPVILTMPAVHGTPINEHAGQSIAINAFPSLFPKGKADFAAEREDKVTMTEWAAHLMRYKDGRFARHPRFRYWALNTIMRHDAKKASQWFTTTHKEDKELTVEEIKEMLAEKDAKGLADRVVNSDVPDAEDDESDSESIQGKNLQQQHYQAEWMQEAGRAPDESVQLNLENLGKRDMDLEYDWVAHSADQATVKAASSWLSDQVKEPPNDEIQTLPENNYKSLKGEQHEVFLQVMAYFKRMDADELLGPKPPPLRINVDGTAGTKIFPNLVHYHCSEGTYLVPTALGNAWAGWRNC